MTSQAVRDPFADHFITPQKSAFLRSTGSRSDIAVRSMNQDLCSERGVNREDREGYGVPVVHSRERGFRPNRSRRCPRLAEAGAGRRAARSHDRMNSWEESVVEAWRRPAGEADSMRPV